MGADAHAASQSPRQASLQTTCGYLMELTAKLGTKSPVWQYFGLAVDEHGKVKSEDQAVCRLCQRTVMAKGSNTSNLQSHLKNYHLLKFAEVKQIKSVEKPTSRSCGQVMIELSYP